jgi:hypothetical protein
MARKVAKNSFFLLSYPKNMLPLYVNLKKTYIGYVIYNN